MDTSLDLTVGCDKGYRSCFSARERQGGRLREMAWALEGVEGR